MLEVLERDVARLPELLADGEVHARSPVAELVPPVVPSADRRERQPVQLGLF